MHKTNNHSFLALSATTEGAAPLDAAPSVVINKKYKNALEIKRHATSEGMDVDSAGSKAVMLLEVGETNVTIKADTEVTSKLIADRRLKSKREGFALFQIVQG